MRGSLASLTDIGRLFAIALAGWLSAGRAMHAEPAAALPTFEIEEYRVLGATHLTSQEIEDAVYPYMGPGRTAHDVELARQALVKVYQDKNISSVDVTVPPQHPTAAGLVYLKVTELTVGQLRVTGAKYSDLNAIKKQVPSMAPGSLIDFAQAEKELVGLSQLPDRRITPAVAPGIEPGTVDVNLEVKDSLPLHGSVELNNRYSADTPDLRLAASLSYDNLWQLGHSIGGSYEVAPQDSNKVEVFTGFYTARFPGVNGFSLTLQGTRQDSNVSTLGAIDVAGKGDVIGLRANFKLPTLGDYLQTFTVGIDYKNFEQNVAYGTTGASTETPTTYVPLTFDYTGAWSGEHFLTDLDAQVVFNLRGFGSTAEQIDANRYDAQQNFIYLRGSLLQTQDLWRDFKLFAKVAGQVSDSPLINSEEFAAGGVGTVRGYLEAEVLGDDAVVGTIELRSPSLLGWMKRAGNEWRIYLFADGAFVHAEDVLPEQQADFTLGSFGLGTRIQIFDHLNGSLDLAIPVTSQVQTHAGSPFLAFRVYADF
jgi:hemolysin activation/secretion protein